MGGRGLYTPSVRLSASFPTSFPIWNGTRTIGHQSGFIRCFWSSLPCAFLCASSFARYCTLSLFFQRMLFFFFFFFSRGKPSTNIFLFSSASLQVFTPLGLMLLYALLLYGSICQPVWTLATIGLGISAVSILAAFLGEMASDSVPDTIVWISFVSRKAITITSCLTQLGSEKLHLFDLLVHPVLLWRPLTPDSHHGNILFLPSGNFLKGRLREKPGDSGEAQEGENFVVLR